MIASLNNDLSKTLYILPLVNVFDTSAGFIGSDYFQPAERKMKAQFNSPRKWTTNEASTTHQLEMEPWCSFQLLKKLRQAGRWQS